MVIEKGVESRRGNEVYGVVPVSDELDLALDVRAHGANCTARHGVAGLQQGGEA